MHIPKNKTKFFAVLFIKMISTVQIVYAANAEIQTSFDTHMHVTIEAPQAIGETPPPRSIESTFNRAYVEMIRPVCLDRHHKNSTLLNFFTSTHAHERKKSFELRVKKQFNQEEIYDVLKPYKPEILTYGEMLGLFYEGILLISENLTKKFNHDNLVFLQTYVYLGIRALKAQLLSKLPEKIACHTNRDTSFCEMIADELEQVLPHKDILYAKRFASLFTFSHKGFSFAFNTAPYTEKLKSYLPTLVPRIKEQQASGQWQEHIKRAAVTLTKTREKITESAQYMLSQKDVVRLPSPNQLLHVSNIQKIYEAFYHHCKNLERALIQSNIDLAQCVACIDKENII